MNDEKKKLVVLCALAGLILAIGAFQMVGKSGPAAKPTTEKKEEKKKEEVKPEPKNPQVAFNLPTRDPFQPDNSVIPDDVKTPPSPTPAPDPVHQPVRQSSRRPAGRRSNRFDDIVSPMPITGTLPEATAGPNPGGSPVPSLPVAPKVAEPVFGYTVAGVIVGDRSAAVMRDAQGAQRLVSVGSALDADSTVTSVTKEGVTIRFRGKALRLSVGGNANAKQ